MTAFRVFDHLSRLAACALLALATCVSSLEAGVAADFGQLGSTDAIQKPLVIRYDNGGRLKDYLKRMEELEQTGQRVEIRGRCNSSCTIYLGAPNVCVAPGARLGFHGPRFIGKEMAPDRFDFWSQEMASFYPGPVARWYMRDARFKIEGVKVLRGSNLAQMGIPLC